MPTVEQENFERMCRIREESISKILLTVLGRIARVHQKQDTLEITDCGFQNMSPNGYKYSIQGDVIKELQEMGYKCSLSFDPHSTSKLTVSGW